jgi:polar amino acid transport system permease protein
VGYHWDFAIVFRFAPALLHGTVLTLELTAITIVFGTLLGALVEVLRRVPSRLASFVVALYIEVFRALPLLVLLVWLYYLLPLAWGIRISSFLTAAIAMTVNLSAFAAVTIRSGLEAVPRGQNEAALALGMNPSQVLFRIVLPQTARVLLPNLLGLYITMLKLSSLASVIAVYELLHSANTVISQVYRPLEIYTVIALIYLILVLPMSYLSKRLESRVQPRPA